LNQPREVISRLVFKAHRLVYHSTLGWRVIKKKKKKKKVISGDFKRNFSRLKCFAVLGYFAHKKPPPPLGPP